MWVFSHNCIHANALKGMLRQGKQCCFHLWILSFIRIDFQIVSWGSHRNECCLDSVKKMIRLYEGCSHDTTSFIINSTTGLTQEQRFLDSALDITL